MLSTLIDYYHQKIPIGHNMTFPQFESHTNPFPKIFSKKIARQFKNPALGMAIQTDALTNRGLVSDVAPNSSLGKKNFTRAKSLQTNFVTP